MSSSRLAPEVTLLDAREVPLGGTRAITVRRSLPSKDIRTVGPWCFVDHYGPHDVSAGGMDVPPHPHTGLQTVSWLLAGEVEHRDSVGSLATIRPGELNLMTSGRGIAHSEVSVPATGSAAGRALLHGVQLWVALPDAHRHQPPHFEHHADLPRWAESGVATTVVMGTHAGHQSPAAAYSPIVAVHLALAAGLRMTVPLDPAFEHALLGLDGTATAAGADLGAGELLYVGGSRREVALTAATSCEVLLLGGTPFEEELVMWWNFVGRSHDEIAADREDWAQGRRFGDVHGYPGSRLAAPALPTVTLRPRPRRRP
jgi:quercetin 2,3-dioxygenase